MEKFYIKPNDMPSKIIVLGRGIKSNGELSSYSYERAVAAAKISQDPNVDELIFSGGTSYVLNSTCYSYTEAEAMANEAKHIGVRDGVNIIAEIKSKDTVTNILECMSFIDHDKSVGILAHADHIPRALWTAELINPDTEFIPIEVICRNAMNSVVEKLKYHRSLATEITIRGMYRYFMRNVEPGDTEEIEQINSDIQSRILSHKKFYKKIFGDRQFII